MNHQPASQALQSPQRDESNMCTVDHLAIFQIMILQYPLEQLDCKEMRACNTLNERNMCTVNWGPFGNISANQTRK